MSFLTDLTLGRYYPTGSVVHRLDPRTKLTLLLISFALALLPERPAVAGLAACVVLIHLALARAQVLD